MLHVVLVLSSFNSKSREDSLVERIQAVCPHTNPLISPTLYFLIPKIRIIIVSTSAFL